MTKIVRIVPFFSIVAALAVGCVPVDNTGGEPPPGESVSFRLLAEGGAPGDFSEAAFFVDQDNADTADACVDGEDQGANAFCTDALAELEPGERLVMVRIQLGGCLGTGLGVVGMYLDGTTLNAHAIQSNSAYGMPGAACTADIGATNFAVAVTGAADAEEVTATVGVFNPDLPGGPAVAETTLID